VPGVGWARNRAFWVAGAGRGAVQDTTSVPEYPLGRVAGVKVFGAPGVSRPKSVRLDYEKLEGAMSEWATHRASALVRQLGDALRSNAYGG